MIEDDNLLENKKLLGKKSAEILKKNLIANLSTIKNVWKPKQNLMVMKLQNFTIKKLLRWTLIILVTVIS